MKIIFVIFITLCLSLNCAREAFAAPQSLSSKIWREIDSKPYSNQTKRQLKIILLNTIQQTSSFCNKPILPNVQNDLSEYIILVDEFYKTESNQVIPIAFVLRIAFMQYHNMSENLINDYQLTILKNFNK